MAKRDGEWATFVNEYKVCKRKLESKEEALKILMKDVEDCQVQRDIFKNKSQQLHELDGMKEILNECFNPKTRSNSWDGDDSKDKEVKTFMQLLQKSREENDAFKNDLLALRQLYSDAQRDNQLLREAMAKCQSHEREYSHEQHNKEGLILQMEEAQNKIESLQTDVKFVTDELAELREERDHFKDKVTRLNTQLNHILHNDNDRLIDVDAVVLENDYLKQVVKQYKEERAMAMASMLKYKNALQRKLTKAGSNEMANELFDLFKKEGQSPGKHVSSASSFKSTTVEELHKVTQSLTEALTEKDLSLMHQRNTNRALGTRVRELERKLKTLEVSGLWNTQAEGICSGDFLDTAELSNLDDASVTDIKPANHDKSTQNVLEIKTKGDIIKDDQQNVAKVTKTTNNMKSKHHVKTSNNNTTEKHLINDDKIKPRISRKTKER